RLGWPDAQAFGRAVGRLAWRLPGRDKERSLEHLAIAFPEKSAAERQRLAHAAFRHFGTSLAECLWLGEHGPGEVARHVRVEGWAEIERARAARRPILILSAHCGNWELIHASLNPRGLGLTPVARGLDDPVLGQSLLDFRARMGTPTIVRGEPGAARDLLRALRSPHSALGILIDQDTDVEGVFVDFFGRPAWTPVGAAELALRFGASVLPTFDERLADGSHLVTIHPELELPSDPVAATQRMTAAIEAQIRRVPEQWVWMHRRWRRRPENR
ncbi:MAG TPA: lysophospholipid acyltransferase family protein, partial [Thermoanaerobaculia bacterium]|nr:lysophospholipid acyltransferase family protein [Thermoanaerobaculia bacterium]